MKATERDALLRVLRARFEQHPHRHPGIPWAAVQSRLESNPRALKSLQEMEATGGEPDVIGGGKPSEPLSFVDCSPESPAGRRSTCYDARRAGRARSTPPRTARSRWPTRWASSSSPRAQYRELQALGEFDTKTSSWIQTPPELRTLGGALFCDRRYGKVFVYHNGVQSYYAARGFRGVLRV